MKADYFDIIWSSVSFSEIGPIKDEENGEEEPQPSKGE